MYKVEIYQDDNSNKHTLLDLNNKISNVLNATLDKQEHNIDALNLDVMHGFIQDNDFKLNSFKTLASVTDTKKNKLIFKGRVIVPEHEMNDSGAFSHNLVFEGAEAYLKDTIQKYSFEFDKEPRYNLELVINHHNSELPHETYKHFQVGTVNVEKNVIPNDGGYHEEEKYFKRWEDKDTYQTLHDDLKGKYGGTFIFEYTNGPTIVHWLKDTGVKKDTVIKIAKNLKNIQYRIDPSEVITRLKPLGVASETANGDEIRLTIADANNGSPYIDIPDLIAIYGVQTGVVDFDAYAPITLKEQAQKWIDEQYQKLAKISISLNALDLSLIGIDTDEYELFNIHRVQCPPLKIDEDLKIVGLGLDLITPHNKTITIGEKQLTIADLNKQDNIKIINNVVPGIVNEQVAPIINNIKTDIENAESKAVADADELARQRVQKFIQESYEPFKLSIPDIMNAELSDFKNGELSTIISNTITTNGESITNDVVTRINNGTNVIRGDAVVVDAAMIGKIAANQTLTDKLVANEAFIRNFMASNIVTDKIKATDIDLNKATISGTVDSKNYVVLTSDYIRQYGNYATTNIDGEDLYVEGYTEFRNGRIRIRNDISNSSLYYCHDGVYTNVLNKIDSTAGISFSDSSFGSMGMYIFSSGGGIGVNAFTGKLMLAGNTTRLLGDSSLTLESTNAAIRFQPLENLRSGTNTFELWVQPGDASSTDGNLLYGNIAGDNTVGSGIRFYKNGAIVEATNHKGDKGSGKFRGTAFENSSWIEYKQDITSWEYDALSVILNELDLYQYKYKADTSTFHRGVIIGDGYSVPPEFVSGEAVNLYEMIVWSLRAIQQLGHKNDELENRIKVLEDKINGTTETTETTA